jgi:hypothetical protein
VNDGNFKPIVIPTAQLKEAAAKAVMEEIGTLLVKMNTPDSGRLLESILQLLPDDVFKTLAYLVVGNESDETARALMFEIVFRIVQKLGLEFDNPDPITDAAASVMFLINAENLRRKGQMEYLAPDNIFTSHPKHPGFNKLTDSGKDIAFKQILERSDPTTKLIM